MLKYKFICHENNENYGEKEIKEKNVEILFSDLICHILLINFAVQGNCIDLSILNCIQHLKQKKKEISD